MTTYQYPDYLMHYGVLGMKWGRRKAVYSSSRVQKNNKESSNSSNIKTAIKVGAGVAGASLAVYGGYKASQYLKTPAGKRMMDKGMSKIDDIVDDAQFWADNTAIWGKTLAITAKKKMLK